MLYTHIDKLLPGFVENFGLIVAFIICLSTVVFSVEILPRTIEIKTFEKIFAVWSENQATFKSIPKVVWFNYLTGKVIKFLYPSFSFDWKHGFKMLYKTGATLPVKALVSNLYFTLTCAIIICISCMSILFVVDVISTHILSTHDYAEYVKILNEDTRITNEEIIVLAKESPETIINPTTSLSDVISVGLLALALFLVFYGN